MDLNGLIPSNHAQPEPSAAPKQAEQCDDQTQPSVFAHVIALARQMTEPRRGALEKLRGVGFNRGAVIEGLRSQASASSVVFGPVAVITTFSLIALEIFSAN